MESEAVAEDATGMDMTAGEAGAADLADFFVTATLAGFLLAGSFTAVLADSTFALSSRADL